MVDPISTAERFAKLALGAAKLVIGGERVGTAAEIFKLVTDGRGLFDDLKTSAERTVAAKLMNAADEAIEALKTSPDWDADAIRDAEAHLRQALPHCRPAASDIAAAGNDAAAVTDRLRRAVVKNGGEIGARYAEQSPSRRLFEAVLTPALDALINDPVFAAEIEPALWRNMFRQLNRIEANTEALGVGQAEVLKVLSSLDAKILEAIGKAAIAQAALENIARTVLKRAEGETMSPEEVAAGVEKRVANLAETIRRLEQADNLPGSSETERRRIADLYRAGRFEEAEDAQEALTDRELEEISALQARLAEDTARAAQSATDRYDHLRAAALWAKAAAIHAGDEAERWRLTHRRAKSLYDHGFDRGDNDSLAAAIAIYRDEALPMAPRGERPEDWATTMNGLGVALKTLGEREKGAARIEETIGIYRSAQEVWTRDKAPKEWSMLQNNLATALATIGEREQGVARLEEAANAHREALEVRSRAETPVEWAITQNNLGNVLSSIGQRQNNVERLLEAVDAYGNALAVRTKEAAPRTWAMTKTNRGVALKALGERDDGTEWLERAVEDFADSLEERPRERLPLEWAATMNNLGTTLALLGEREPGTARLEQAIEAWRAALTERTRDRVPVEWGETQTNMAIAFFRIAERRNDPGAALAAAEAATAAMEAFREVGHASHLRMAEQVFAHARAKAAQFAS